MSVNTAHANNGVLIHAGEYILLFSENVTMEFSGQDNPLFKGSKSGRIYLTTHRMIFNSKNQSDPLQSFSFPFVAINDVDIEQPTFGANYIKGKVRAQPNGNWIGEAKFKLYFKSGGAIDFGQAMLKAARMAQRNFNNNDSPPPYTPPTGSWHEAPPPAYAPNPQGYYGWVPPTHAFPNGPPPNTVFMTDNPPPYPGLVPTPQLQGFPPMPFANTSQYPPPQHSMGYPQAPPGYSSQGGFPSYPMGSSSGQPGGYFPQQQPGFQPQSAGGYSPQQPGFSQQNNSTAMTKEQEAAQSAYYDPNQPQTAFVPPAAYYEPPPSYNSVANKKDQ